uniref:EGF-like domain-containing protein n=1 Tax=Esox lucius TaxID=8010 RepID=A0AAY5KVE9_ESOLU
LSNRPYTVVTTLVVAHSLCEGQCISGQFQCANGQCIDSDWRCDGIQDCTDDTDELNCSPPSCNSQQFKCLTGSECIPLQFVCDGEEDCNDGSDEQRACGTQTCGPHQFTCHEGQCIPKAYQCDHLMDCLDNSDEKNCNYPTCNEKTCANGACYNNSQHCNGLPDCRDGSDESNCTTQHCSLHQFQCTNGYCIPTSFVCDHWNDCGDNSDEHSCVYPSCSGTQFTCPSGLCIPQDWVCDKFNDCGDYSDEKGCDSNSRDCYPGEWACPDSPMCVPVDKVCDGKPDCPGGTDETDAATKQTCSGCSALSCVYMCHLTPQGGACFCPDGFIVANDSRSCVDYDDCDIWGICDQLCEDRPGTHHCSCADGYFLEQGNHCRANISGTGSSIAISVLHIVVIICIWVKIYCDIKDVLTQAVRSAENIAVDWINLKLYVLETTVERIDMCDFDGDNRVTLVAENLLTPHGLALDPTVGKTVLNGGTQVPYPFGISVFENHVFFTDWNKMGVIRTNRFNGSDPTLIYRTANTPGHIVVAHPVLQPMVMSPCGRHNGGCQHICVLSHRTDNDGLGFRCKCRLGYDLHEDGRSCFNTQILTGYRVGHAEAMAYDWTSKVLFWTSSNYRVVVAFGVNDKSRRDIVTDLKNPRGLAIHPSEGYLFWSDWYRPAVIMRSWTDGSNAVPLINTTLGWPNGLAIDYKNNRLYWVDALLDQIGHVDINGYDRQMFSYIGQITQPFSLTIQAEYLFVSDTRTRSVFRMQKRDGGEIIPIRKGISGILNVKAYTSQTNELYNSQCNMVPNGHCSHFCFPAPSSSRVCGCPYGMKLQPNQRDCVKDDSVPPVDTNCGEYSFLCDVDRCHPNSFWCDGIKDCLDQTDEANCTDIGMTCSPHAFTCDNKHCIMPGWRCDGHDDCGDYSDEVNCPTRLPFTCSPEQFPCTDGSRCIPKAWTCDADKDCSDGSDERDCNGTISTCQPGYFFCPDHRCIYSSYVCDGDQDCMDGSDEKDCEFSCSSSEFACVAGDQCVQSAYRCDGVYDCRDHSDENGCPTRGPGLCHDNEFQCQMDGLCLPGEWECDGHRDCEDGSDEHNSCPTITCQTNYFQCANGNCISPSWVCDGDNDCRDMSDEQNCPTPPFTCASGQWLCPTDQVCIALGKVCDGQRDCPNGADESPLCSKGQLCFSDRSQLQP